MNQPIRNLSTDNYRKNKKMFAHSLQKKQNIMLLAHSNQKIGKRHNRCRVFTSDNLEQKKDIDVKEMIDNYFQEDHLFKRTMPLINNKKTFSRVERYKNQIFRDNFNKPPALSISSNGNNIANIRQDTAQYFKDMHNPTKQVDKQNYHHLPPIHQITQDGEDRNRQLHQNTFNAALTASSFLFRSASVFSEYLDPEKEVSQSKIKTFQNQIFTIFVLLQDGRPVVRLKQFKQQGMAVLARQMKILSYQIPTVWRQCKINNYTLEIGLQPPLKDLICKIRPDQTNPTQLRISPRPLYKRLKADRCQQLRSLLRGLCKQFQILQGKVINNKINLGNIFLTKDEKFCVAQWGHSSFRQIFNIQSNNFQTRVNGILQGNKNWFVSPEYLAPQIVSQILGDHTYDIWNSLSSPDIWSLGLLIFELLTLIPIWASNKCFVVGKPQVIRSGLLSVPGRDLKKLYQKQMTLQRHLKKCLQNQTEEGDKWLTILIIRMVQPNPQQRITWKQLLNQL